MKIRVPINENKVYSEILYYINKEKVYASEIAEKLNKSQATLQKQLNFLVIEGYLIAEDHPKKKKNIKLFSINWKKITKEYYNKLLETSKDRLQVYDNCLIQILPEIKNDYEHLRNIEELKNKIIGNELLIKIFKNSFISMKQISDIYDVVSLDMFFTEFCVLLTIKDYNKKFKDNYNLNHDEENFLKKLSIICSICSRNLILELAFLIKPRE